MTDVDITVRGKVLALRREFDLSFAAAPAAPIRVENFLAVRVGGEPYAVRLAEIAGLYVDRRIVPLPTPVPELLGMAAFRGQTAPVYDLAALLHGTARATPRWLLLVRAAEPLAFAFEAFESQLMVAPDHLVASPAGANAVATRPHTRDAVHSDGGLRPIVQLASIVTHLQQRLTPSSSSLRSDRP